MTKDAAQRRTPRGHPLFTKPSTITKRLKEAGELLGIPVLDHIIIDYSYFSIECNYEYNFEDEEGG